LSGLGSDGAKGAQAVKEKGGVVMVQEPADASFSNMPLSTIISDHPDFIGTTEQIAEKLCKYVKAKEVLAVDNPQGTSDDDDIQKIITQVSVYSGVNFREYKPNTLLRRIDKRIKINHLSSVHDYHELLQKNPEELRTLFNDLLIGVTEFFRDKESFMTLEEVVIPDMCKNHNGRDILRLWVAGCSTGEEAYSVAMLLEEYIQKQQLSLDFKLFATDLNPKAIELAGRGQFSALIENQVPPHLLHKYFFKKGDLYEINKEIRKKLIFSVHNLLSDPPFIRLDFISCRNLFIYLKEDVQKKLLYTFNYSLHNEGYLMVGANETDGDLTELFEKVSLKSKIFKNNFSTKRFRIDLVDSFNFDKYMPPLPNAPARIKSLSASQEQESYAELLVNKYAPDCLLLSEANEVLYTTGRIERYFKFPNKRTNLNIFDMVKGNFSMALRNGLSRVREAQTHVMVKDVLVSMPDGGEELVDLSVYNHYGKQPRQRLVVIEINGRKIEEDDAHFLEITPRDSEREIERLEAELQQCRKELVYTSDELEAINEELQSSNEEMKSSNEEMQTTNEELQSTNEELKTVNMELQSKIEEISTLHDDVTNLFITTQIATIFLDRDLKIRKYTPAVQQYFNIRESDIGRPIEHYTFNFEYDDLKKDITYVLRTLEPLKKEVKSNQGYAMMKMLPYKTNDMRIEGVVITIVDITELTNQNLEL
jgi:two-component system CheB/CheR fusion protein